MYAVERVGASASPVVVIDDFHPHFDHLRGMAARSTYRSFSPFYPGVQAPADPRHLEPVKAVLDDILRGVFSSADGTKIVQCSFSRVTTPDADLAPIQRLPHVDTIDPNRIALLHYLGETDQGGTSFYRHSATGFETLTEENFAAYKTALESEGLPKPGYMRGTDARFECLHTVAAKPNRAVLYRSHLLHSGHIPEGVAESGARLTLNTFLQI